MKILITLSVLFAVASADISYTSFITEPGEINADNFESLGQFIANGSKIANGAAAKKGENMDLCYLTVKFLEKSQTCGCFVYNEKVVITSARCVYDTSEKKARIVIVTFPQLTTKPNTQRIISIVLPDGENGDAALAKYDFAADTPFDKIGPNNIALLKLEKPLTLDNKFGVNKANIGTYEDVAAFKTKAAAGYKFRACGIGQLDNNGLLPKGVMCTDVNFKDAVCESTDTAIDTTACLQWDDRDNNLCIGDFGGPIYAYKDDASGKILEIETFCTSIGSPNVRLSAPCFDAHKVICTFLSTPVKTWIENVIAGK